MDNSNNSNQPCTNEVRIFNKCLSPYEIKNNIFDKAITILSTKHLTSHKCKLYNLIREDNETLTVTSETTKEDIEKWANGMNVEFLNFYNQVNQDEAPVYMNASPFLTLDE